MASKWIDRIATPKIDPMCVENISEFLIDSSKIGMIKLLDRDEKYKNEKASDFELLKEWEEILPLCQGSGAAGLYEAEKKWLCVNDMGIFDRWNIGSERVKTMDFSIYSAPTDQIQIHRFVSDFIKSSVKETDLFSSLISQMKSVIEASKQEEFHLILNLSDAPFLRPNPYAAGQILEKKICGEKCNDSEESLLLLQSSISLIRSIKSAKKIVLHIYAEASYNSVFETIEYLAEHRLFSGDIYVGIFLDTAHRAHERLCRLFARYSGGTIITLHTELILTVADFAEGLPERMMGLFRLYPRRGVCFGGVLSDSPAYFIADQLALHIWNG